MDPATAMGIQIPPPHFIFNITFLTILVVKLCTYINPLKTEVNVQEYRFRL